MASAKAAESAVSHRTAVLGGPARSGRGAPTRPRQRSGSLFSSEPRRLSARVNVRAS